MAPSIRVAEEVGTTTLQGRPLGRRHFLRLCEAMADVRRGDERARSQSRGCAGQRERSLDRVRAVVDAREHVAVQVDHARSTIGEAYSPLQRVPRGAETRLQEIAESAEYNGEP